MFWKLMALVAVLYGLGLYFSVTMGGLIHVLPVAAVIFIVGRRMGRSPNTEFGKWRPYSERGNRR